MDSRTTPSSVATASVNSAAQLRARPVRGIAVILALIAVAAAVILAVTLSSTSSQSALTSDSLARTAKARAASAGGIDIACALVDLHGLSGFGTAESSGGGGVDQFFPSVTIGSSRYVGSVQDLANGGPISSETTAIRIRVEATSDEIMQLATAVGRLVQPDTVVRADLDLSEFGLLTTGGEGSIELGADTAVGAWKASPLSVLREPVLIGSSNLDEDAVNMLGDGARGYAVIRSGQFPVNDDEFKESLAGKTFDIPLTQIPVPEAPRPGRSEYALAVDLPDAPNGNSADAWNAYHEDLRRYLDPSRDPLLVDEVDAAKGNINFDTPEACMCDAPQGLDWRSLRAMSLTPVDPASGEPYPAPGSGQWRQIDFAGNLRISSMALRVSAPTLLIVRGDLVMEGAAIFADDGVPLTIVVFGAITIDASIIVQSNFADDGTFYPRGGASNIIVYATRDTGFDDPSRIDNRLIVDNGSIVAGQIYAPTRAIDFNTSALYGRAAGSEIAFAGSPSAFYYDPGLNNWRGWSTPVSAMWVDEEVRSQLAEVSELTDEAIALAVEPLTEANVPIRIEDAGNGIVVPIHAGFAGGDTALFEAELEVMREAFAEPPTADELPPLAAVVRDFREESDIRGMPGFGKGAAAHRGGWEGVVSRTLDANGKPAINDDSQAPPEPKLFKYLTSAGEEISAALFDPGRGDVAEPISNDGRTGEPVADKSAFDGWFADDSARTLASVAAIKLEKVDRNGETIFTFALTPETHPVRGRILGELPQLVDREAKKDAYTLEMTFEFQRNEAQNQYLEFETSGDLWVFINGSLVAEHGSGGKRRMDSVQTVPIERLGIRDGTPCEVKLFFAARETPSRASSSLRIASTMPISTPADLLGDLRPTDPAQNSKALRIAQANAEALRNGGLPNPRFNERSLGNWMRRFE